MSLCAQTVLCVQAEFMGEAVLVDLHLQERSSYLELCFDALKDFLARYDL